MANLKGKTIMITGAGGGVGEAMALKAAEDNCNIILTDVSVDAMEKVAAKLSVAKDKIMIAPCDIRDQDAVKKMVEAAIDRFGRIDCLAHCAGVITNAAFEDLTAKEVDFVIDVNTKGTLYIFQAVGSHMAENGGGKIAAVASKAGKIGVSGIAHYCASKFGVIGLVQTAAMEWGPKGVYVNCVCPGEIDTAMLRKNYSDAAEREGITFEEFYERACTWMLIGRVSPPSGIADALKFLLCEESDEIMGQSINTDGGIIFH